MKRILLLTAGLLILFGPMSLQSQTAKPRNLPTADWQPFHFGYSVGINSMGFVIKENPGYTYTIQQRPGININLITNLRLGKYFDLRFLPGIQFGQRDLTVSVPGSDAQAFDAQIESVYLDFPIFVKYRASRVNNFAPYLIAGVNPKVDLTGGEIEDWKAVERLVKPFDVFPELGVGIDFYLARVKLATELKFAVGLLNIVKKPENESEYSVFNQGINSMRSNMVQFVIHIEK